nr:RecName: Full=Lactadherin; AltName: Full=MFGM; AltName: Full=Milk fat globule-EGF factor 8; Short=MFG-E8; AltName: Full=SED1 [Capra hircus]
DFGHIQYVAAYR